MATTYEWSVAQVELIPVGDLRKVVHKCFWKCAATGTSGKTVEQYGVIELDVSNLNPDTFVSFDNLTEEQIVTWIKSKVAVQSIESSLHPDVETHSYVQANIPGTVAVNVDSDDKTPE
jgi:hypothetical protein